MSALLEALQRLEARVPRQPAPPPITLRQIEPVLETPVVEAQETAEPEPTKTAPSEPAAGDIPPEYIPELPRGPTQIRSFADEIFAELELPPVVDRFDFATALPAACLAPATVAMISVGVADPVATLRDLAQSVSDRLSGDVVLLGPGTLDDAAALAAQWDTLRSRAAYAFIHASSDVAMRRIAGLRATAGVALVVELGRTATNDVRRFTTAMTAAGISVLGVIILDGVASSSR
jgi:hypothetical protein